MEKFELITLLEGNPKGNIRVQAEEKHNRYRVFHESGKLTSAYFTPKILERMIKRGKIKSIL